MSRCINGASRLCVYDRATAWQAAKLTEIDATLPLPALGAELPLAEIYADTPLPRFDRALYFSSHICSKRQSL